MLGNRSINDLEIDMLEEPLLRCAEGHISANIALMQLIFRYSSEADFARAVSSAAAVAKTIKSVKARERLEAVFSLLQSHPASFRVVNEAVGSEHRKAGAFRSSPEATIAYWNRFYDRAVGISAEASVAAYSLGDAGLLRQITARIVACLQHWHVLSKDRNVLDFGCGIGRMEESLSGFCREIVGVDISSRMLETASRRCSGLNNVTFLKTNGYELSEFNPQSFDIILVIDVLPPLTPFGPFVHQLVTGLARLLRQNGDLIIFNYSWRIDGAQDQEEVEALAERLGLSCIRSGTRDIDQWDGTTFHLKKL